MRSTRSRRLRVYVSSEEFNCLRQAAACSANEALSVWARRELLKAAARQLRKAEAQPARA